MSTGGFHHSSVSPCRAFRTHPRVPVVALEAVVLDAGDPCADVELCDLSEAGVLLHGDGLRPHVDHLVVDEGALAVDVAQPVLDRLQVA